MPQVIAYNPRTGEPVGGLDETVDLDAVVDRSARVASEWARWSPVDRAEVLDGLARALDTAAEGLAEIADLETALGQARLIGEVARSSAQFRMFADVVREGAYLGIITSAGDERAGQVDIRRTLVPLGPVAVFAASNFPFAFSVAGGDVASALAVGCPVIVKVHEGHPLTSQATFGVMSAALAACGAPSGILQLAVGRATGVSLVEHPGIAAVGFTGSGAGGRYLMDRAAARPAPIPFYAELGGINPVVVLASAPSRREQLAREFFGSFTLGGGQFCTKPGLVFVPADDIDALCAVAAELIDSVPAVPMLTRGMRDRFVERVTALERELIAVGSSHSRRPRVGFEVVPRLFRTELQFFRSRVAEWSQECFGPMSIVVAYSSLEELLDVMRVLPPSLAGAVHASEGDPAAAEVIAVLSAGVGRVILNGWPTGVAVVRGMHHGGPWPASNSTHTSVGATATRRWQRPIAYQGVPDVLLPPALQRGDPWELPRQVQVGAEPRPGSGA